MYHSTNLAKSLGYTHFYRIEYDCRIEKIENVKNIINQVENENKKGLIYLHQNKFVSFQIWYFDLEYFTNNFPKINNEEDYIVSKSKFNYDKDFISAEEFIYNVIKTSDGDFSNLIVKDAPYMHTDFGDCRWNTIMTPLESEKIIDGFISSVHRITYKSGTSDAPEACPNDDSKVSIITWNCSSSNENISDIKIYHPNGEVEEVIHKINGTNGHLIKIISLTNEDTIVDMVINGHSNKRFILNKNTISNLNDVYHEHN